MSLVSFAEEELKRWEKGIQENPQNPEESKEEIQMQKAIDKNILALVKEFASQGHSGFSGQYVLDIFERLVHFIPIMPLTGEEEEWENVSEFFDGGKTTDQNKRCSSVFRENHDNQTAYMVEGIVFSEDQGETWFSSSHFSQKAVTFPFRVPSHPDYVVIEKGTLEKVQEEIKGLSKEEIRQIVNNPNFIHDVLHGHKKND